ncbi:MAG: VirB8/TrbF family protein [Gammaproteobacteria bacterium]
MWKILNKIIQRKNGQNVLVPPFEESRAVVMSQDMQNTINALKPKIELSAILVDRNKWALTAMVSTLAVVIACCGWYQANERYSNHVRVAFVKLDESGEHNVSIYDENSTPTFFMNTVYSLLGHYIERRYSKTPFAIKEDYGFVSNFMSPALKNDFYTNYHAAKVAADFEICKTCSQTKVTVRTIQHQESDQVILNGKVGSVYRSTVFARATSFNSDGTEISSVNQIITLTWRLKDIASLSNNLDVIQANPIGIEILSESLKIDPTPVNETKLS